MIYPRNAITPNVWLFTKDGVPRPGEASTTSVSVLSLANGYRLDSVDNTFRDSPAAPDFQMTAYEAPNTNLYFALLPSEAFAVGVVYNAIISAKNGEIYSEEFTISDENAIDPGSVSVTSPLTPDGSLTLTAGSNYFAADQRAIALNVVGGPSLAGATCSLVIRDILTEALTTTIAGTIVSASSVSFDVAGTVTAPMHRGPAYSYSISAVLTDGTTATLQSGVLTIDD